MNISIVLVAFGAVMLFVPQTMWIGLGLLAIGGVLSFVLQKEPLSIAKRQSQYMNYLSQYPGYQDFLPERRARSGVEVNTLNASSEFMDSVYKESQLDPKRQQGPRIEGGMLKMPVPLAEEITQLTDITYNVPTKAKQFTQARDKGGNPLIPGFND
jgi:hypothetical protein